MPMSTRPTSARAPNSMNAARQTRSLVVPSRRGSREITVAATRATSSTGVLFTDSAAGMKYHPAVPDGYAFGDLLVVFPSRVSAGVSHLRRAAVSLGVLGPRCDAVS